MKRILLTGAFGQIGTELTEELRRIYGGENVLATDLRTDVPNALASSGPIEQLNIMDKDALSNLIKSFNADTVFHLAALLSATGEKDPTLCWNVNMNGTLNVLHSSLENKVEKVYIPSSIAVWGNNVQLENTPQNSILQPTTMYGVTKVAGEALCNYYVQKYGLDIRGIRYPGIISSEALPGGGTTDYAVEIYYEAIKNKSYNCFLSEDTTLPMMYMPDCIKATIDLMEADFANLKNHSDYNVAAFSFSPKEIAESIKKHIPDFSITYSPDFRQKIADSWPKTIDDSQARNDWNWQASYTLETMTKDMIEKLSQKHEKGLI